MSVDTLKSLISKKRGVARSNAFRVILPVLPAIKLSLDGVGLKAMPQELNLLCTNVNLPGRQILTNERLIGIKGRKLPYGFASDDVNMTFLLLNDYGVKEYFEQWQNLVIDQDTYEIGYPQDYAGDVIIDQLERGFTAGFQIDLPGLEGIATKFLGIDTDVNLQIGKRTVYSCRLLDAFPTTMNVIELSNELDGLVQLNVQLSYRNWDRNGLPRRGNAVLGRSLLGVL